MLAGGGVLLQGTTRDRITRPLAQGEDDTEIRSEQVDFGAAIYTQGEVRYFILDRWNLGLAPRISLPLTNRAYPRGRQLPRFATTFEVGAFLGVLL